MNEREPESHPRGLPLSPSSGRQAAIEFYKKAFGAAEEFRLTEPSGRVGHAQLKFGAATVMVSDAYPERGIHGPKDSVSTGSSIHLHVEDVDAMTQQAVATGAKLVMEPKDQFYWGRTSKTQPLVTEGIKHLGGPLSTLPLVPPPEF